MELSLLMNNENVPMLFIIEPQVLLQFLLLLYSPEDNRIIADQAAKSLGWNDLTQ